MHLHNHSRNLDAFQDGTNDILGHDLRVNASRYIEVDDLAIPTGNFTDVSNTPLDFRKEAKIGARWNETVNLCGTGNIFGFVGNG
jgi:aldose 1-epimerase